MSRLHRIFCLMLAAVATEAEAARIVNLSPAPRDIPLTVAGQDTTITLAPNAAWESSAYPIYARIGGHRLMLDPSTEYAYWPDGTLMPQHRIPPDGRGS